MKATTSIAYWRWIQDDHTGWPLSGELPLDQIRRPRGLLVRDRGLESTPANRAAQAHGAHQPFHRAAIASIARGQGLLSYAAIPSYLTSVIMPVCMW
jgi:hypothetical protein